jgi:hypothetical protein
MIENHSKIQNRHVVHLSVAPAWPPRVPGCRSTHPGSDRRPPFHTTTATCANCALTPVRLHREGNNHLHSPPAPPHLLYCTLLCHRRRTAPQELCAAASSATVVVLKPSAAKKHPRSVVRRFFRECLTADHHLRPRTSPTTTATSFVLMPRCSPAPGPMV